MVNHVFLTYYEQCCGNLLFLARYMLFPYKCHWATIQAPLQPITILSPEILHMCFYGKTSQDRIEYSRRSKGTHSFIWNITFKNSFSKTVFKCYIFIAHYIHWLLTFIAYNFEMKFNLMIPFFFLLKTSKIPVILMRRVLSWFSWLMRSTVVINKHKNYLNVK